jgi:hypothetical protein
VANDIFTRLDYSQILPRRTSTLLWSAHPTIGTIGSPIGSAELPNCSFEVRLREPDTRGAFRPGVGAGRNHENHIEYRCCSSRFNSAVSHADRVARRAVDRRTGGRICHCG